MRNLILTALLLITISSVAQPPGAIKPLPVRKYAIVIKGGHVIDPKNNIDRVMDVAIGNDRKIALVAANINGSEGAQVVDARGLYVTPGLIDIHSHNFWGSDRTGYANGSTALPPDGFTFRNGVTTIVDAGSPGAKTFATYKRQTIDRSRTRVLAFLHIVGQGMANENDTTDMNAKMAADTALAYKQYIVGFKAAHYTRPDWTQVDRAVQAGNLTGGLPVMVDFGGSYSVKALSLEELLLKRLRPGDIFTHAFAQLMPAREFIIDTITKKPKPFVLEARRRGIIFDVGYGGISFDFQQAIPAIKAGFYPNTISTDIHTGSYNNAMKDMLTTMTKFLAIGMPLKEVIKASSWEPARAIRREELGHLSVGAGADVAILGVRQGKFGVFDYRGFKVNSNRRLECEMTIRNGAIVYDFNGIANPVSGR